MGLSPVANAGRLAAASAAARCMLRGDSCAVLDTKLVLIRLVMLPTVAEGHEGAVRAILLHTFSMNTSVFNIKEREGARRKHLTARAAWTTRSRRSPSY